MAAYAKRRQAEAGVGAELVGGATIAEVDASVERAKAAYDKLHQVWTAQAVAAMPPGHGGGGGPAPAPRTAFEMIRQAIEAETGNR